MNFFCGFDHNPVEIGTAPILERARAQDRILRRCTTPGTPSLLPTADWNQPQILCATSCSRAASGSRRASRSRRSAAARVDVVRTVLRRFSARRSRGSIESGRLHAHAWSRARRGYDPSRRRAQRARTTQATRSRLLLERLAVLGNERGATIILIAKPHTPLAADLRYPTDR
jgi:hypothetical protein